MLSRKKQEMMKERLIKERDELIRQREALDNQVRGLERAIALVGSDNDGELHVTADKSGKRVATKSIVLDLLQDVGTTGLNAQTAVNMAKSRGFSLDKASVSSLLSRLKKEDILSYDKDKYRLRAFSAPVSSPSNIFN